MEGLCSAPCLVSSVTSRDRSNADIGRDRNPGVQARTKLHVESVNNAYLAAKSPWLQRQFRTPLGLGDLPFIVGRGPVAGEGLPPLQPDLKLR